MSGAFLKYLYSIRFDRLMAKLANLKLAYVMTVVGGSFVLASAITTMVIVVISPVDELKKPVKKRASSQTALPLKSGKQRGLSSDQKDLILERNLFNSEGILGDMTAVKAEDEEVDTQSGQIPLSRLKMKVLGVIYGGSPYVGLAMIKNRKSRVASYLVGEAIEKRIILREVYESRIVVENRGKKEYLLVERKELVRSSRDRKNKSVSSDTGDRVKPLANGPVADSYKEPGFERSGHEITLSADYRENLLGSQMSKILQDAKAEPNMVDGELKGFRLTRIREDSIYQKVGLQSQDVVHEINGVALRDAGGAISLLRSLRNEKEIEVRVQRGADYFNMTLSVQ